MSLVARGLEVERGGRLILDGVDLKVEPGQCVALAGPSGAGKSTLLAALAGELGARAGEVRLEGEPVAGMHPAALARRRAVLTQRTDLRFGFRVMEVVLFGRAPHCQGVPGPEDRRLAQRALELSRASHLIGRIYTTLSGGEQQRVHLARALAQLLPVVFERPGYLLLDEPTSSLDPAHAHAMMEGVLRLCREGLAVCVVLHDLDLAARFADRIALMRAGRMEATGTPRQVLTSEHLARVFGLRAEVLSAPGDGRPLIVTHGTLDATGEDDDLRDFPTQEARP